MSASGFVAVLVIDLHFPEAESLKSKRKELSSLKAHLRGRLGASVAEVDHQDTWQRAAVAVAVVAADHRHVRDVLEEVERFVAAAADVELFDVIVTWVDLEDGS